MKTVGLPVKLGVVGVIALAFALSGCSEVERTLNRGGDTPCSDFLKQNPDKQRVTVTKLVKERSGQDHEPAGAVVDASIFAVSALCNVQSNAQTPIKNANIAGIFAPPPQR